MNEGAYLTSPDREWLTRVAQEVADRYDTTLEALRGRSRKRQMTAARQLIYHFGHEERGLTYAQLGLFMCRDHSTVSDQAAKIMRAATVDESLREELRSYDTILAKTSVRQREDQATALENHAVALRRAADLLDIAAREVRGTLPTVIRRAG